MEEAEANFEQAARDLWGFLEQVVVEGAVEEQVDEEVALVVQVGWVAAGEQADLEAD